MSSGEPRFHMFGHDHWAAIFVIAATSAAAAIALRLAARGQPATAQPETGTAQQGTDPAAFGNETAQREAGAAYSEHHRTRVRRIRRLVCRGIALGLIAYLAFAAVYRIAAGDFTIQEGLPLHLCDIAVFVVIAALWFAPDAAAVKRDDSRPQEDSLAGRVPHLTRGGAERTLGPPAQTRPRWRTLFELTYFWGLGGTVQAVLTPHLNKGFPSMEFLKFFASHGLTIVAVSAMTVGLRLRPGPWSPLRAWLITNALVPPILLFNWLTGSNYMYLMRPPPTGSILDLLGARGFPDTLLILEALALVFMLVLYLPFWLMDHVRDRTR